MTHLGDTLGKRGLADVSLIERGRTHLWKPLLHMVAAGSMDLNDHELDYLFQARWHHFQFRLADGLADRLDGVEQAPERTEQAEEDQQAGHVARQVTCFVEACCN